VCLLVEISQSVEFNTWIKQINQSISCCARFARATWGQRYTNTNSVMYGDASFLAIAKRSSGPLPWPGLFPYRLFMLNFLFNPPNPFKSRLWICQPIWIWIYPPNLYFKFPRQDIERFPRQVPLPVSARLLPTSFYPTPTTIFNFSFHILILTYPPYLHFELSIFLTNHSNFPAESLFWMCQFDFT